MCMVYFVCESNSLNLLILITHVVDNPTDRRMFSDLGLKNVKESSGNFEMGCLYECVWDKIYVTQSTNMFQGNIDLKIEQKPSMQLTGGQAATHYEDVDRKASVVDQGSADGGKQLIDQTGEINVISTRVISEFQAI